MLPFFCKTERMFQSSSFLELRMRKCYLARYVFLIIDYYRTIVHSFREQNEKTAANGSLLQDRFVRGYRAWGYSGMDCVQVVLVICTSAVTDNSTMRTLICGQVINAVLSFMCSQPKMFSSALFSRIENTRSFDTCELVAVWSFVQQITKNLIN